LICDRFYIELSLSGVGKLLKRLGLTPQKLLRRAYERDEEVVKEWVEGIYPKIKEQIEQPWMNELRTKVYEYYSADYLTWLIIPSSSYIA